MNNKGFAISTLIYGLSIMGIMIMAILLGIMTNIRSNTREITRNIENELILYGKTEKSFDENSKGQSYIIQDGESGWYRIELWGAQGGDESKRSYGAYTSGVIKLMEGDSLYFNVGKRDANNGAGESTDVRIINGNYNDSNSYNSRIMVAAGGGTGSYAVGGTIVGYNMNSIAPGGSVNSNGTFNDSISKNNLLGYSTTYNVVSDLNTFNLGPIGENGGGSGYYSSKDPAIGGVSYIAGYAGSGNAYTDSNGDSYYFIDGNMFPGVNRGPGKAKITKVLNFDEENGHINLKRINSKLNNIVEIRDCLKVSDGKNNENFVDINTFSKIVAIKDGKEVGGVLGTTLEDGADTNYKCRKFTFSDASVNLNLDEIAVWHNPAGRDYFNHRVEVKGTGGEWRTIINDDKSERSMTDTSVGLHISAYQPDSTEDFPSNGNYYILPVLEENKMITASKENLGNSLTTSFISGEKTQIWSIEELDDMLKLDTNVLEYKIVDLAHFKAMEIKENTNKVGNNIVASTDFNNSSRTESQIWKIEKMNDGTFAIKSVVEKAVSTVESGYIVPRKTTSTSNSNVIIGEKDLNCQKYRLISLEYHHES